MKALTWHGKYDVRIENVPDPKILNPRDAILKVTSTCICGSDLHLYDGYIPQMKSGDILGHEFMGEIVELGPEARQRRPDLVVGDRVVIPFTIACGNCYFCQNQLFSCCDNSNPTAETAKLLYGKAPAGLFGYSHILGGYAGGQAEYVRVPFADVGPYKVPDGLTDDQVVFLTDIFPTGYQAAYNCGLTGGETVAIWGAGPVGLFALKSAQLLGAEKVIVIDEIEGRLKLAAEAGATTINFRDDSVFDKLEHLTGGRGPDAAIDCVGLEACGAQLDAYLDQAKAAMFLATDRPHALRQAIMSLRKAGTLSIPGVYGGLLDKVPMGAAFAKGLTMKMGQTHVQRWLPDLMAHIQNGDLDPTFIISHRMTLADAPEGYRLFKEKRDDYTKIVLNPS
jgi:threonine dehydrogenase-like Zn-dependent dehydrogenase